MEEELRARLNVFKVIFGIIGIHFNPHRKVITHLVGLEVVKLFLSSDSLVIMFVDSFLVSRELVEHRIVEIENAGVFELNILKPAVVKNLVIDLIPLYVCSGKIAFQDCIRNFKV